MDISAWINRVEGKYIDEDGVYGSQCVDVIINYVQWLFPGVSRLVTLGRGNAKDLWGASSTKYFDKIPNDVNDPNQLPRVGDIVIWGAYGSNPYGHIAVCLGADSKGMNLMEQNGFIDVDKDGNADGVAFRKRRVWGRGLIGWLRPKIQTQAPTQGDIEMIKTRDQAVKMYRMLRPNSGASEDEIVGTVGRRSYEQFVNDGQKEVEIRDQALREREANNAAKIAEMQQVIAGMQEGDRKSKAELEDALEKIRELSSELEAEKAEDLVVPAPLPVEEPEVPAVEPEVPAEEPVEQAPAPVKVDWKQLVVDFVMKLVERLKKGKS